MERERGKEGEGLAENDTVKRNKRGPSLLLGAEEPLNHRVQGSDV